MNTSSYFLPPEWAPQSGVMLTWPNANNSWTPSLEVVELCFVDLARNISLYERVLINCLDEPQKAHILELLSITDANLSNIQCVIVPSNDVWARDHGPITVMSQNKPLLLNFEFNSWGGKYNSTLDNQINSELYKQGVFKSKAFESIEAVLEGGSIEVDDQGTLLTTESCLLNKNRNASMDKKTLEQKLKNWFGVDRILWLNSGYMAGDDTDGHIDTLARFTDSHTIAYMSCEDSKDEHYDALLKMCQELESFKAYDGKPYKLVPLPMPAPQLSPKGDRLPATYANFLIINQAVLVPTYDDSQDEVALERLAECFPDRKIIPVYCRNLIEQFGSLHCVTMQLPEGVL